MKTNKPSIPIIKGNYTGPDHEATLTWEDPETGLKRYAWGQFNVDESGNVEHEELDEQGNVKYIVTA